MELAPARPGVFERRRRRAEREAARRGPGRFALRTLRRQSLALWRLADHRHRDRKSTRLNSSHVSISYAVFCLKKKKKIDILTSVRNSNTIFAMTMHEFCNI